MGNWKRIKDYPDYEVSDKGEIKSLKAAPRILVQSLCAKGYPRIGLTRDGATYRHRVHRLVAEAFIPNPDNKPTVDHIDGNKQNNCLLNLRWATYKEQQVTRRNNQLINSPKETL